MLVQPRESALPHLGDLLVIPRYEEVPKRSGDALSVATGSGSGYQRILLAVDGSAHSTAAAAAAADLASANGAEVLVLHVWDSARTVVGQKWANAANKDWGGERSAADQLVSEVVSRLSSRGIAAKSSVRAAADVVASEIVAAVAEFRPDLVAVGSRGRRDLASFALGSVSHRVLARVNCPVLIGRSQGSGSHMPLTRILLAVAGNEGDAAAIEAASAVAVPAKAAVLVLHVLPTIGAVAGTPYMLPLVATAEIVRPAADSVRGLGLKAEEMLVPGSAASGIVETAQANHAGMIVLGPGRRGSDLEGFLLGDVSHEVIHLSDRSVLMGATSRRKISSRVRALAVNGKD